jgi:hypothetical protein
LLIERAIAEARSDLFPPNLKQAPYFHGWLAVASKLVRSWLRLIRRLGA